MSNELIVIESQIKMPLMSLPVKMTIVRLDEQVILISPLPDIENFKERFETLGQPTDIVASNGFHHMGIEAAHRLFPKARLWAPPVLKQKRSDIEWTHILPGEWPFSPELEVVLLGGMPKIDEAVFFHKDSKSLIVSDLCFNHIEGKGFGYWLFFHLFGTYKRFAVSKFFAKFVKDREKFKASLKQVFAWDFEKIILPHGVNVLSDGKSILKEALNERGLF